MFHINRFWIILAVAVSAPSWIRESEARSQQQELLLAKWSPPKIQFCGSDDKGEHVGQCVSRRTCRYTGTFVDSSSVSCDPYTYCCKSVCTDCYSTTASNIGYWQNPTNVNPSGSANPGPCFFTIRPAADTCWIRLEFEDGNLDSASPDTCDGNTLRIYNQAQGQGSIFCGALTGYETLVKVDRTGDVPLDVLLNLNLADDGITYNIKYTRLTCDQINGINPSCDGRMVRGKDSPNQQSLVVENTIKEQLPAANVDKNRNPIYNLTYIGSDAALRSLPGVCIPGETSNVEQPSYFGMAVVINDQGGYKVCGATLISDKYLLTSASCMLRNGYDDDAYVTRVYFDLEDLELWRRDGAHQSNYLEVERLIFHPMYEHHRFDYDIAVIELEETVSRVPVDLPCSTDGTSHEGELVRVLFNDAKPELTRVNTVWSGIVTAAACEAAFAAAAFPQIIDDNKICAEHCPNYEICLGNVGGAVVSSYTSNPVLIGIIANDQKQEECMFGVPNTRDIYVANRITSVLDFIEAATSDITLH